MTAMTSLTESKVWIIDGNPTAENLAGLLADKLQAAMANHNDIIISKLVLWETPTCSATWERSS
ncbi:unnamed protein product [marine sediment metagenome]|uniref:Uncharacterized protein n=1 Tax=marine sediment metagenome TaxID=412755 RepID=X0Y2F8_9ZZZZ